MKHNKTTINILVIPNLIPFPPNDGGKLCIFSQIDYLRKFHTIHLLLSAHTPQEKEIIKKLILEWPDVTIHSIDLYPPEILNPRGKVVNLLKKAIKRSYYLLKEMAAKSNSVVEVNDGYNLHRTTPFYPHTDIFIKKLRKVISENKFDIIQTELTRMLNLVNIFPDAVKKIFVQIEGRSDVIYDYGISNNIDPDYVQYVAGNTKFIEYAFMKQYDAIFALSEADKINIQQNVTSKTKVYTSPFGILDADINDLDVDSLKFENLIFMGGEGHHPNADALSWFLTDIINKFTIRPFNKLYVTGEWSEKTINKYKQLYDCVDFVGFVDDLTPYLKNSISIVPIRIGGGGIRTKILSAMAQGSPVVATSLSAMGIKYEDKKNLLIANTAGDFVNAINNLFNDGEFARNISREAHGLIVKDYTQSRVGEIRNKIYEEIFYGQ